MATEARIDPVAAPPPDALAPDDAAARSLVALNRIARIATQDLALGPMLQRIVDALQEHFGWEFIACARVDREAGVFVCEAVHSDVPTDVVPGYSRPLGSGVVGTVALEGRTIELEDTTGAANFIDTLQGTRAEL